MLRNVDGWEGEHFSFGVASAGAGAAPAAGPTPVAIDNGADGPSATIPDSHLLFTAQFSRAGADLVLTGEDGKAYAVHDYFAGDARARLLSAEGATLSADVVAALAGPLAPGQYAQAGAAQPTVQAVGRVVQADGDATIVRNGVAMAAHAGDPILKGDVLQTVSGTFGVTFNDGSTLNLTANSRLVVNEFVYDPKGSANSQLLDLVQGSLTFISGEVAHNGDMKIGTPVATMAIRGTVGGVTTANDGTVNFYVSQSATGAVILDSRGTVIANVVQDGPLIVVRPVGPLQVLAEEVQKTPAQLATELAALQQIVSIQSVGQQIIQQFFQQDPNANPNPQSTDKPHTQFQIDLHTNNPTGPNGNPGPNDGNPTPPTTATVTQTTTDGDGNKTTKVEEIKLPANLAPVNFGPLQQTIDEDHTVVFSAAHQNAISVFDADTASLTVTLTATHGVLSLHGVAGLAFTSGDGSCDATMTFSGTQAAINAALDGMSFTPAADYNGQASVTVVTGDGIAANVTETVAITVNPVNDAPVLDYFNLTVADGGTTVLTSGAFHITDPDSSSFFFTVANVTGGQFEVLTDGQWVAAPTGGFTADDIAASHVRFVHDGSNTAPSFTVWASDGTDAGQAIDPTVDFTPLNHAPTITSGAASGGPDQIQHETSTGLSLDETDGVRGLATDGTLLYVNDDGGEIDIYTLAGSFVGSHAVDNLAGGSNQMTFAGGHLYARNGDTIFLISTQDWSSTAVSAPEDHGLLTAKSWMTEDMLSLPDGRIGVLGANEDDTTTLRLYTVGEDGLSLTWSEDIILQTDGQPGDNHGSASDGTYVYIADYQLNGYRSYSLATGELTYTSGDITDSGTGADVQNPTFLTHDHVNGEYIFGSYDIPVAQLSAAGSGAILVAENTTAVTTITATDPDAGTTLTYSIAGGADGALFDIDAATGALSFKVAPDYEAPADDGADNVYDVVVQVSDGALTDSKALTVRVTNVDDGPPSPEAGSASVSEEGLPHGVADQVGSADTTDNAIATGTIASTGGGQLHFSLGLPATALSSGGHPVSWALDDQGTLSGKVGAETIITVSINDSGDYTVTLLGPVDHPDTSLEDVKALDIPVNVSNDLGTATTTLTVNIEDDSPAAAAISERVVPGVAEASVNIVIILDVSGSMNTAVSPGVTRLSLAKDALDNLLNTDAAHVNQVMVVAFSGGIDVYPAAGSHWTDAASANAHISGLSTGGGTNYDDATSAVMSNWGSGPTQADKTLVYFISDGAPSTGHGLDVTETTAWENFLSTHGISVANAIGISTTVDNPELAKIAWAPENADLSPIVLEHATDLDATLQGTVPTAVTHNIFDGNAPAAFGADGGHIQSISVDGYTYTWDGNNTITKTGGQTPETIAGSSISVVTGLGGTFKFAFGAGSGHAAGDWSYAPASDPNLNGIETFHYVLVDNDGDHAAANITVTVDGIGNLAPVLANVAPAAAYTENGADALLAPDLTVTDADSAMLSSAMVKISADFWGGDLLYANTGGTNIQTSYNSSTGELRLFGADTAEHYQQVLQSVRYASYSDDPTNADRQNTRTIDWQVGSSFEAQTKFDAGSNVYAMTAGDVNGDGKTDLVVSNIWDQTVSVMLGNGDGTFQARASFAAGGTATGSAIADMNGDGKADIVATNFYNGNVSVLLGAGDGTFQAPVTQSVTGNPIAVAVADLDGDGHADIVTANYWNNNVSVLFGNGDGTFRDLTQYAIGANPQYVAFADFNNDGKLDIVTANTGTSDVSVLLGNGDGTFQCQPDQPRFATGGGPASLTVADLNADGKLDLVTADYYGNTVSVLFGAGDGTFGSATVYGAGHNPSSVMLGDVNADGKADLVVGNSGDRAVSVLLGNGDGTFQVATTTDVVGGGVVAGALLDLNGDGRPDLVTANAWDNSVSVLIGNDTNLSTVAQSTINITSVNDAPSNQLPEAGSPPNLVVAGGFALDQYLAVVPGSLPGNDYSAAALEWMQNYAAGYAADYAVQANVIDYSNDPNPWGDFPGFSYWPSNLDQNGQYDRFFAVFTGKILVASTDTFSFRYNADDGAVLLVDGQMYTGSVELSAGAHDLQLYYYDYGGGAIVELAAAGSDGHYALVGSTDVVASGADLVLTGFGISDPDAGAGDASMQTILSVAHGVLAVSAVAGAVVTGSGTDTVVISGLQAQINATLHQTNNIVYTSASDFHGTDTLTMTTDDQGNAGTGGPQTTVSTLDIVVNAAPSVTLSPPQSAAYVQSAAPLAITSAGNVISDADGSQLSYAVVKLTNAHDGDALSLIGNMPDGITASDYNAATGSITLYGQADHAAYQTALSQIAFSNSTIFPGSEDRVIEVTVNDGAVSSSPASVTINVVDTDDAPIAHDDSNFGPAGFTLNPDNGHWYKANTNLLSWSDAQAAAVAAGGYLATIGSAEENAFVDQVRGAAVSWVAWLGGSDTDSEGHWIWNVGPETGQAFWEGDFSGTALAYDNWRDNEPNGGTGENYLMLLESGLWNDASGGSQLYSIIEVSPFVEDHTTVISAASLLANDRDEGSLTINSVDDSQSHGTVTILQNGDLQYMPDANYNGAASFAYTVIDAAGHVSNAATVSFTVEAVNDAPLFNLDNAATVHLSEVSGSTTLVGLAVADVDAAAQEQYSFAATAEHGTLIFEDPGQNVIVGGNGATLTAQGSLTDLGAVLDAGITYYPDQSQPETDKVTVIVNDGHGGTDTLNFIFNVTSNPQGGVVSLAGTAGKDVLIGTNYNDTLTGNGAADTFVFTQGNGADVVTDFSGHANGGQGDVIALSGFNFDSIAGLQQAATISDIGQDGDHATLIDFGSGHSITLEHVDPLQLVAADFIFPHAIIG